MVTVVFPAFLAVIFSGTVFPDHEPHVAETLLLLSEYENATDSLVPLKLILFVELAPFVSEIDPCENVIVGV